MTRLKLGVGAAFLFGAALTAGLVLYVGFPALAAAAAAIGPGGFAVYVAYNTLVFVILGLAWWSVAPGVVFRGSSTFIWARLVREAASDVLPLAQVTGLVVGLRAVSRSAVGEAVAVASLVADLTTEMAAQVLYTLFGVAMLTAALAHVTAARSLALAAGGALALGCVALIAFVSLQGRSIDLVGRLAGRWLKDTEARADAVRRSLAEVYREPVRIIAGFSLHACAWVASGLGSYLALRFMGDDVAVWRVLTLESLMAAVRGVAFMSPGALGVQEGAYVLAAPLLGLNPGHALALSLLKRAKDVAVGVPALLLWQADEGRALLRKRPQPVASD